MIKNEIHFKNVILHSAYGDTEKIPENPSMPQFAFCGRSNSGKSSMINAICGRKKLVRVSSTPGKTKEINLFLADDHFFLVDLPGFGFAKASHNLRDSMIERVNNYLNNSTTLKVLFILCDSSRKLPDEEINLIKVSLKKEVRPVLIRTKTDKLNQQENHILKKETDSIQNKFKELEIIHTSVKNNLGINRILEIIKSH